MNTMIGIVSILLFHGIWNDEHVVICSVFIIINQIILLLVNILLDDSISTSHWFYHFLLIYFQFYWMISSINLLCYLLFWFYKYEWYYQNQYWYQNSFQILVIKGKMISILILIEYYLQQSSILSILDLHQIRKNRWNIYSFIIFIQILVIDLDWIFSNEIGRSTVCRFGISIQYSIIQYQTRKSNWTRILETKSIRSDRC